jgi:membrane protein implicated in regulation of membrane protease activity
VADEYLVGKLGSVVRTVRGGRLPGEVRVVIAGSPDLFLAYSDEMLEAGTRIKIVRSRGSRQVDVEAWPRRH